MPSKILIYLSLGDMFLGTFPHLYVSHHKSIAFHTAFIKAFCSPTRYCLKKCNFKPIFSVSSRNDKQNCMFAFTHLLACQNNLYQLTNNVFPKLNFIALWSQEATVQWAVIKPTGKHVNLLFFFTLIFYGQPGIL